MATNAGDVRLVLVGKTGAGKSSTANTIFGQRHFAVGHGASSETKKTQYETVILKRRQVTVMDSPGLFDTSQDHQQILSHMRKAVSDLDPGPHAVLFVHRVDKRFTEEDYRCYQWLKTDLGQPFVDHMLMIFTHGDKLKKEKMSITDYLHNQPSNLSQVLQEISQRYLVFDNRSSDRKQVYDLLRKIDSIGGSCLMSPAAVKAAIRKLKEAENIRVKAEKLVKRNKILATAASSRVKAAKKKMEAKQSEDRAYRMLNEAQNLSGNADIQVLFSFLTLGLSMIGAADRRRQATHLRAEAKRVFEEAAISRTEAECREFEADFNEQNVDDLKAYQHFEFEYEINGRQECLVLID